MADSQVVFVIAGVVVLGLVLFVAYTLMRAPKLPPAGSEPSKDKSDKSDRANDDTLKKVKKADEKKADEPKKVAAPAETKKDDAKKDEKKSEKAAEKKKDEPKPAEAAKAAPPAKIASADPEPVPAKPEAAPIEAPKVVDKAPSVRPAPAETPKSTPPVASPEPVAAAATPAAAAPAHGDVDITKKAESIRPVLSSHSEIQDDAVKIPPAQSAPKVAAAAPVAAPVATPKPAPAKEAAATPAATPAKAAAPAAEAAKPAVEAKPAPAAAPAVEAKKAPVADKPASAAAPAPAPAKSTEPDDEAMSTLSFLAHTASARWQPDANKDEGDAHAVLEENHLYVLTANPTGSKTGAASKLITGVKAAASTKRGRTSWKRAIAGAKTAGAGDSASLVSAFFPGGGPSVEIARLGDAAAYRLRGGNLTRITGDGSVKETEHKKDTAEEGDLYILCSAELCRTVPDEEIRELLMLDHNPNNGVRDLLTISGDRNPTGDVNVLLVRLDPIEI